MSDAAEDVFKNFFIFGGQGFAGFNKVFARDFLTLFFGVFYMNRFKCRVIGNFRVAGDVIVVLNAAFGREAVVIPAYRVEYRFSLHALVSGDDVGLGVAEDVSDMQRTGNGRRRCINHKAVVPALGRIVFVNFVGAPVGIAAFFYFFGIKLFV